MLKLADGPERWGCSCFLSGLLAGGDTRLGTYYSRFGACCDGYRAGCMGRNPLALALCWWLPCCSTCVYLTLALFAARLLGRQPPSLVCFVSRYICFRRVVSPLPPPVCPSRRYHRCRSVVSVSLSSPPPPPPPPLTAGVFTALLVSASGFLIPRLWRRWSCAPRTRRGDHDALMTRLVWSLELSVVLLHAN